MYNDLIRANNGTYYNPKCKDRRPTQSIYANNITNPKHLEVNSYSISEEYLHGVCMGLFIGAWVAFFIIMIVARCN